MSRRVRIEVTAEDIANGTPEDSGSCPIALACRRRGFREPSIDSNELEFGAYVVPTPSIASDFIAAFDSGEFVEPFAFEIEVEEALAEAAAS